MFKNRNVSFILNGVVLTLAIPLILGLILFLWIFPSFEITFKFTDVMLFATATVAILTFILHTINGNKNSESNKERNKSEREYQDKMLSREKQKTSYSIVSIYTKPEMVESLRAYRDVKKEIPNLVKKSNVELLKEYFKENPKDHSRIHMLLNSFESIAVQIKRGFLDEEIIKDCMHSMFYDGYKTLNSYIKDAQSDKGHEKCWDDFVNLCKNWGEPR